MNLVDVHCHLDHSLFKKDLDEVIMRAKKNKVSHIITNGSNPSTNRQALAIASRYSVVQPALGLFPLDVFAQDLKEPLINIEAELNFITTNSKKIAAIGEAGLDFKYSTKKEKQKILLTKLLTIAHKINKPIILHSRGAEAELVELLKKVDNKKIILHCFEGKHSLVKTCLDNGWFFSIPTNVVRSKHFQTIVNLAPTSQLLTETDAPFLSSVKNQRNEPSFVTQSINKIAELKRQTPEQCAQKIFQNFYNLFSANIL